MLGFTAIRLIFDLTGVASPEEIETLVRLTQRYCVVFQTLVGGVPVNVSAALA